MSSSSTALDKVLYLHACHGSNTTEVHSYMISIALSGREKSPAQAFVSKHWGDGQIRPDPANMDEDKQVGRRSHVVGLDMCVRNREGCSATFCSLLFAEVSCAMVTPGLTLIALIPPSESTRSSDRGSVSGWFVFWCGKESLLEILDNLGQKGCLRSDFVHAFPKRYNKVIGQGAHSTVYCMQNWDAVMLAVKKLNASVQPHAIEREVVTLMEVQNHANVVSVHGFFVQPEHDEMRYSLVFDLAPLDLLTMVYKSGVLTEDSARPIFRDLLRGLAYIHTRSIVHRDIKTENILIDAHGRALISDFGLAAWLSDEAQMSKRCGSPGYVAPEMCVGHQYGCKVDVFGSGIVLYFMLSKEVPFITDPNKDAIAILKKTVACQLHLRRAPWDGLSSALRRMLRATICKTASERLSASEALEHVWLQTPSEITTGENLVIDETTQQSGGDSIPITVASVVEQSASSHQNGTNPETGSLRLVGHEEEQCEQSQAQSNPAAEVSEK